MRAHPNFVLESKSPKKNSLETERQHSWEQQKQIENTLFFDVAPIRTSMLRSFQSGSNIQQIQLLPKTLSVVVIPLVYLYVCVFFQHTTSNETKINSSRSQSPFSTDRAGLQFLCTKSSEHQLLLIFSPMILYSTSQQHQNRFTATHIRTHKSAKEKLFLHSISF